MNIMVDENEASVEVCVNITSSLTLVMRNVTIDVLIEPGVLRVLSRMPSYRLIF